MNCQKVYDTGLLYHHYANTAYPLTPGSFMAHKVKGNEAVPRDSKSSLLARTSHIHHKNRDKRLVRKIGRSKTSEKPPTKRGLFRLAGVLNRVQIGTARKPHTLFLPLFRPIFYLVRKRRPKFSDYDDTPVFIG